jgi:Sulfotransferase family
MNGSKSASGAWPASVGAADRARLPPICSNPVFVIGSPRSGTTMLARSLAEHSELWASGESDVLFFLFANGFVERSFDRAIEIPGRRWLRLEDVSREEFLAHLGMGINALITSRSEGRRWIDHTPQYALIVETLAEVFPGASFIHILRDGRDVVHSMLNFADAVPDPAVRRFLKQDVPWATDMRRASDEWRDHVEAAMAFCDGHSDRATVVRYEDLVAAPQTTFRTIHRFLGIADEEGPARFLASRRINSSFGEGPRLSASELWGAWDEEQRRVFAEVAGATMLRCGYSAPDELGRPADADRVAGAFRVGQRRGLMRAPDYARLVSCVREVIESDIPPNALVLVATRGDDEFLAFEGPRGWHFPRDRDGTYAGRYPTDSEAAIAHLEELRAQGATHLVLPETAFWWLAYYEGLRRHLDTAYQRIGDDERVIVYDITCERPRSTRKAWSMASR